jgi:hypothetical protein
MPQLIQTEGDADDRLKARMERQERERVAAGIPAPTFAPHVPPVPKPTKRRK